MEVDGKKSYFIAYNYSNGNRFCSREYQRLSIHFNTIGTSFKNDLVGDVILICDLRLQLHIDHVSVNFQLC